MLGAIMKRLLNILLAFILFESFSSIKSNTDLIGIRNNFSIDIYYFVQPHIENRHYNITSDSIRLYLCKTSECNDSVIFKTSLSENQSINYYNYIHSLNVDTLGQYYDGGGFDGLDILLKIKDGPIHSKTIYIHNYKNQVIQSLIGKTNELILLEKYKIEYP